MVGVGEEGWQFRVPRARARNFTTPRPSQTDRRGEKYKATTTRSARRGRTPGASAAAEAAMAALQSWRKAYGALKDTTTVSLANLNSDFKVRPPSNPHSPAHGFPRISRPLKPAQFVTVGRVLTVGSMAALLRCTPGFIDSLRRVVFVCPGSGCRDREGHQPRGEPAQGAPPAQCVDSSHVLPFLFFCL